MAYLLSHWSGLTLFLTDAALPLAYNFNGMVHVGEAGMPDAPNGYRGISDRGLLMSNDQGSIGAGWAPTRQVR